MVFTPSSLARHDVDIVVSLEAAKVFSDRLPLLFLIYLRFWRRRR